MPKAPSIIAENNSLKKKRKQNECSVIINPEGRGAKTGVYYECTGESVSTAEDAVDQLIRSLNTDETPPNLLTSFLVGQPKDMGDYWMIPVTAGY